MKLKPILLAFAATAGLAACGQPESVSYVGMTQAQEDAMYPMKVYTVVCRDNRGQEDVNERFVTRHLSVNQDTPSRVTIENAANNVRIEHFGGTCTVSSQLQQPRSPAA